jgi:hypothetical protein
MAGFWSGFGEELSSRIRDREEFTREKAEEQRRYLREQGLKRRAERDKLVQSITSSAAYLTNSGLDEERVKMLVERDPMALETLATAIQEAAAEGRTIAPSVLNNAVKMLPDYVAPDQPLSEVINQRFAAFKKSSVSAQPEKTNNSFLAAMLGYDTDTIDKVYSEPMFGEYTGADVAAAIGSPLLDVSTAGSARLDLSDMVKPSTVSISQISAAATDLRGMIKGIQEEELDRLRRSEAPIEEVQRATEQPWTIPAVRDQVDRYVELFDERIYDILGPNYRPVEEEEEAAPEFESETTLTSAAAPVTTTPAAPVSYPPVSNRPEDYISFESVEEARRVARSDPERWKRIPYFTINGIVKRNNEYTGM